MYHARGAAATAELALWTGEADRARAIVEEALAELEGGEFVFYSAPLYTVGARAHADLGLRARALGTTPRPKRPTQA